MFVYIQASFNNIIWYIDKPALTQGNGMSPGLGHIPQPVFPTTFPLFSPYTSRILHAIPDFLTLQSGRASSYHSLSHACTCPD